MLPTAIRSSAATPVPLTAIRQPNIVDRFVLGMLMLSEVLGLDARRLRHSEARTPGRSTGCAMAWIPPRSRCPREDS